MTGAGPIALFDWIVPSQVAACVNPAMMPGMLDMLREAGITRVVNLHEQSNAALLGPLGAGETHLPVADFTPPAQAQLDEGVAAITQAQAAGQPVAVHCGAGLGRTGTLVAAYLVTQGLDATAAIERVRSLRPGSVETPEQEAAVAEFAARRATAP